jgi:hypothetical protein
MIYATVQANGFAIDEALSPTIFERWDEHFHRFPLF